MRVRRWPDLSACRGKLLSADGRGQPVHAGSFLRRREMVLDAALRGLEFRRILVHEALHFAWIRLGNGRRRSWESLLAAEWRAKARGETGWSAEWRKRELGYTDVRRRTRRWREYVCESFCDTGAWILTGGRPHPETTLVTKWRPKRRQWWKNLLAPGSISI